jgi:hypothetical protein
VAVSCFQRISEGLVDQCALIGSVVGVNSPLKKSDLREPVLSAGLFVATVLLSEGRRYTGSPPFWLLDSVQEASILATEQFFNGLLGNPGSQERRRG